MLPLPRDHWCASAVDGATSASLESSTLACDVPGVLTTQRHEALLCDMLQAHALVRHLCVVGGKGSGKSVAARMFAFRLGYPLRLFSLYADMSARDLLQRRTTDAYVTVLPLHLAHGRLLYSRRWAHGSAGTAVAVLWFCACVLVTFCRLWSPPLTYTLAHGSTQLGEYDLATQPPDTSGSGRTHLCPRRLGQVHTFQNTHGLVVCQRLCDQAVAVCLLTAQAAR